MPHFSLAPVKCSATQIVCVHPVPGHCRMMAQPQLSTCSSVTTWQKHLLNAVTAGDACLNRGNLNRNTCNYFCL